MTSTFAILAAWIVANTPLSIRITDAEELGNSRGRYCPEYSELLVREDFARTVVGTAVLAHEYGHYVAGCCVGNELDEYVQVEYDAWIAGESAIVASGAISLEEYQEHQKGKERLERQFWQMEEDEALSYCYGD